LVPAKPVVMATSTPPVLHGSSGPLFAVSSEAWGASPAYGAVAISKGNPDCPRVPFIDDIGPGC